MADPAPSAGNKIPARQQEPPADGWVAYREGARTGWKLPDGSISWDDGEKVVAPSGKSDADKRAEALAQALGTLPGPQLEGVSASELAELRTRAARLQGGTIEDARRDAVKKIARLPPAATAEEAQARLQTVPLSRSEESALLRQQARVLLDREAARVEELKQLALEGGVVLARDGIAVQGNAPQRLHEALLAAITSVEVGDPERSSSALAELRRWSIVGQL